MNAGVPKIPYPWLVFNEKVKVNSVFLRDSTGVSDSVLLLFGGNISRGGLVSSFTSVMLISSRIYVIDGRYWCYKWLLIGWTPENVGRILGIFHETCFSRDVFKLKERTWGTDAEESKNLPFFTAQKSNAFEFPEMIYFCGFFSRVAPLFLDPELSNGLWQGLKMKLTWSTLSP